MKLKALDMYNKIQELQKQTSQKDNSNYSLGDSPSKDIIKKTSTTVNSIKMGMKDFQVVKDTRRINEMNTGELSDEEFKRAYLSDKLNNKQAFGYSHMSEADDNFGDVIDYKKEKERRLLDKKNNFDKINERLQKNREYIIKKEKENEEYYKNTNEPKVVSVLKKYVIDGVARSYSNPHEVINNHMTNVISGGVNKFGWLAEQGVDVVLGLAVDTQYEREKYKAIYGEDMPQQLLQEQLIVGFLARSGLKIGGKLLRKIFDNNKVPNIKDTQAVEVKPNDTKIDVDNITTPQPEKTNIPKDMVDNINDVLQKLNSDNVKAIVDRNGEIVDIKFEDAKGLGHWIEPEYNAPQSSYYNIKKDKVNTYKFTQDEYNNMIGDFGNRYKELGNEETVNVFVDGLFNNSKKKPQRNKDIIGALKSLKDNGDIEFSNYIDHVIDKFKKGMYSDDDIKSFLKETNRNKYIAQEIENVRRTKIKSVFADNIKDEEIKTQTIKNENTINKAKQEHSVRSSGINVEELNKQYDNSDRKINLENKLKDTDMSDIEKKTIINTDKNAFVAEESSKVNTYNNPKSLKELNDNISNIRKRANSTNKGKHSRSEIEKIHDHKIKKIIRQDVEAENAFGIINNEVKNGTEIGDTITFYTNDNRVIGYSKTSLNNEYFYEFNSSSPIESIMLQTNTYYDQTKKIINGAIYKMDNDGNVIRVTGINARKAINEIKSTNKISDIMMALIKNANADDMLERQTKVDNGVNTKTATSNILTGLQQNISRETKRILGNVIDKMNELGINYKALKVGDIEAWSELLKCDDPMIKEFVSNSFSYNPYNISSILPDSVEFKSSLDSIFDYNDDGQITKVKTFKVGDIDVDNIETMAVLGDVNKKKSLLQNQFGLAESTVNVINHLSKEIPSDVKLSHVLQDAGVYDILYKQYPDKFVDGKLDPIDFLDVFYDRLSVGDYDFCKQLSQKTNRGFQFIPLGEQLEMDSTNSFAKIDENTTSLISEKLSPLSYAKLLYNKDGGNNVALNQKIKQSILPQKDILLDEVNGLLNNSTTIATLRNIGKDFEDSKNWGAKFNTKKYKEVYEPLLMKHAKEEYFVPYKETVKDKVDKVWNETEIKGSIKNNLLKVLPEFNDRCAKVNKAGKTVQFKKLTDSQGFKDTIRKLQMVVDEDELNTLNAYMSDGIPTTEVKHIFNKYSYGNYDNKIPYHKSMLEGKYVTQVDGEVEKEITSAMTEKQAVELYSKDGKVTNEFKQYIKRLANLEQDDDLNLVKNLNQIKKDKIRNGIEIALADGEVNSDTLNIMKDLMTTETLKQEFQTYINDGVIGKNLKRKFKSFIKNYEEAELDPLQLDKLMTNIIEQIKEADKNGFIGKNYKNKVEEIIKYCNENGFELPKKLETILNRFNETVDFVSHLNDIEINKRYNSNYLSSVESMNYPSVNRAKVSNANGLINKRELIAFCDNLTDNKGLRHTDSVFGEVDLAKAFNGEIDLTEDGRLSIDFYSQLNSDKRKLVDDLYKDSIHLFNEVELKDDSTRPLTKNEFVYTLLKIGHEVKGSTLSARMSKNIGSQTNSMNKIARYFKSADDYVDFVIGMGSKYEFIKGNKSLMNQVSINAKETAWINITGNTPRSFINQLKNSTEFARNLEIKQNPIEKISPSNIKAVNVANKNGVTNAVMDSVYNIIKDNKLGTLSEDIEKEIKKSISDELSFYGNELFITKDGNVGEFFKSQDDIINNILNRIKANKNITDKISEIEDFDNIFMNDIGERINNNTDFSLIRGTISTETLNAINEFSSRFKNMTNPATANSGKYLHKDNIGTKLLRLVGNVILKGVGLFEGGIDPIAKKVMGVSIATTQQTLADSLSGFAEGFGIHAINFVDDLGVQQFKTGMIGVDLLVSKIIPKHKQPKTLRGVFSAITEAPNLSEMFASISTHKPIMTELFNDIKVETMTKAVGNDGIDTAIERLNRTVNNFQSPIEKQKYKTALGHLRTVVKNLINEKDNTKGFNRLLRDAGMNDDEVLRLNDLTKRLYNSCGKDKDVILNALLNGSEEEYLKYGFDDIDISIIGKLKQSFNSYLGRYMIVGGGNIGSQPINIATTFEMVKYMFTRTPTQMGKEMLENLSTKLNKDGSIETFRQINANSKFDAMKFAGRNALLVGGWIVTASVLGKYANVLKSSLNGGSDKRHAKDMYEAYAFSKDPYAEITKRIRTGEVYKDLGDGLANVLMLNVTNGRADLSYLSGFGKAIGREIVSNYDILTDNDQMMNLYPEKFDTLRQTLYGTKERYENFNSHTALQRFCYDLNAVLFRDRAYALEKNMFYDNNPVQASMDYKSDVEKYVTNNFENKDLREQINWDKLSKHGTIEDWSKTFDVYCSLEDYTNGIVTPVGDIQEDPLENEITKLHNGRNDKMNINWFTNAIDKLNWKNIMTGMFSENNLKQIGMTDEQNIAVSEEARRMIGVLAVNKYKDTHYGSLEGFNEIEFQSYCKQVTDDMNNVLVEGVKSIIKQDRLVVSMNILDSLQLLDLTVNDKDMTMPIFEKQFGTKETNEKYSKLFTKEEREWLKDNVYSLVGGNEDYFKAKVLAMQEANNNNKDYSLMDIKVDFGLLADEEPAEIDMDMARAYIEYFKGQGININSKEDLISIYHYGISPETLVQLRDEYGKIRQDSEAFYSDNKMIESQEAYEKRMRDMDFEHNKYTQQEIESLTKEDTDGSVSGKQHKHSKDNIKKGIFERIKDRFFTPQSTSTDQYNQQAKDNIKDPNLKDRLYSIAGKELSTNDIMNRLYEALPDISKTAYGGTIEDLYSINIHDLGIQLHKQDTKTDERIKDIANDLIPLAIEYGIDPSLALSQFAIESGWGAKTTGDYNYFNIKPSKGWKGKVKYCLVPEVVNGKTVMMKEPFKSYATQREAMEDYLTLMKKHYHDENGNLNIEMLKKYATDPSYVHKVIEQRNIFDKRLTPLYKEYKNMLAKNDLTTTFETKSLLKESYKNRILPNDKHIQNKNIDRDLFLKYIGINNRDNLSKQLVAKGINKGVADMIEEMYTLNPHTKDNRIGEYLSKLGFRKQYHRDMNSYSWGASAISYFINGLTEQSPLVKGIYKNGIEIDDSEEVKSGDLLFYTGNNDELVHCNVAIKQLSNGDVLTIGADQHEGMGKKGYTIRCYRRDAISKIKRLNNKGDSK